MHFFFVKSGETQEQRGGGPGTAANNPLVKATAALYNEGSRSSTSGDSGMIYGSRIYSPFLSICRGHRGQRGNEWFLQHSSPSFSICLM